MAYSRKQKRNSRKQKRNTKKIRNKRIRKSRSRYNNRIYHGGELVTRNIDKLREYSKTKISDDDYIYNELYNNGIKKEEILGKGFQGVVYKYGDKDDLVVKLITLKTKNSVPMEVKELIESSFYASDIGIGPKTYLKPFITDDRKHVAFVMEKIYDPINIDTKEVIELYERSINNRFVTFDFEFGRTKTGNLIFFDFGVSGIYESSDDALMACLKHGVFDDVGIGYYDEAVKKHFLDKSMRLLEKK